MIEDVAPEESVPQLLASLNGLVVAADHKLRFRHPLLREVAYAGLPVPTTTRIACACC